LLVGFGGSGPTIWLPEGETEWRKAPWEGYPFTNDEEFTAELEAFWSEKVEPRLAENPDA